MSERDIPTVQKVASGAAEAAVTGATSGIGKFVQSLSDGKGDKNNGATPAPHAETDLKAAPVPTKSGDATAAGIAGAISGAAGVLGVKAAEGIAGKANDIVNIGKKPPVCFPEAPGPGDQRVPTPPTRYPGDEVSPVHPEKFRPIETDKRLENLLKDTETFDAKKEGITKLSTGDRLVRAGGSEILIAPNGGVVTVGKDVTIEVDSKEAVKINTKDKTTTLTYPNGDSVEVEDGHISKVSRGGKVAESNARWNKWKTQEQAPPIHNQHGFNGDSAPNIIKPLDVPPNSLEKPNTNPDKELLRKYFDMPPIDMSPLKPLDKK